MYRLDIWRDSEQIYSLKALKCRNCGHASYFRSRICPQCGKARGFDEVTVGREGKIFDFTVNYSVPREFSRPSILAIMDSHNGVRFTGLMADAKPEEMAIGKNVKLVFRKIREIGDVPVYGFKMSLVG